MNAKKYIKKYAFLVIILAMIIFAANISKKTSSLTLTRYHSSTSGTDAARVAKWEIESVSMNNGTEVSFGSDFRAEIMEGTYNWAFEFTNKSEVDAVISTNSKVRIRLDSENFTSTGNDTLGWNFINNINNPISFTIKVYSGSIEENLEYVEKEDKSSKITYKDYNELSQKEDKEKYTQQVKSDENLLIEWVSLSDKSEIKFKKEYENVDSKMIYYYYIELNLLELNLSDLDLNLYKDIDIDKSMTFVVDWNIKSVTTGQTSDDVKQYKSYKISESNQLDEYNLNSKSDYTNQFTLNGITYYILESALMDSFEYTKYTSGITGGEPIFEFREGTESVKVNFSNLDDKQKLAIEDYGTANITDYENIKHYVEYLEYKEYKTYLDNHEKEQEALGYLMYGLKVNLKFNIIINQKKPH